MVSDIHRTIVQGQEENSSNKTPVSDSRILVIIERPLIVPDSDQVSNSTADGHVSLHLDPAHLENPRLRHQERSSAAMN